MKRIRTIGFFAVLTLACLPRLAPAQGASDELPGSQAALAYVSQTLDWYRHIPIEERLAGDPEELSFVNNDKQLGSQVLRLSFDFAKSEAQLLANPGAHATTQAAAPVAQYQALSQAAAEADVQVKDAESELQPLKQKLAASEGRKRQQLQSQADEVQSELDLAQARRDTLYNLLQFAGTAGSKQAGGGNLLAQLDEIERSIPELAAASSRTTAEPNGGAPANLEPAASSSPNASTRAAPSGVLGLIEDLFSLTGKIHTLDQTLGLTNALTQSMQKLRAPIIASLTAEAQRGDQLLKEPDSSNASALAAQRKEFESLTADFKRDSTIALPLGKQSILLDLYKANLSRWRDSVKSQYEDEFRNLFLRLSVLFAVLILVIAVSEVWRRAAFRYIRDQRRRYQILLLRKIAVWSVLSVTVVLFFATEIGSLATFAGLITAGIAVALQNVILSVAGYFFLIGKYGVKVGDRVQISGVTGEVIDVGLVRMPLLELGGSGTSLQPTGRVVVFSNSIVFQPNASFFKQIPGTNFGWHEVTLNLAPDCDYQIAEKRMMEAVEKVYADYRASMEQQHRQMEQTLGVTTEVPRPKSRLRLNQSGLEVVIRYPVELEGASIIDDRITRELLEALDKEPSLRLVGPGTPNIQPVPVAAEQGELAEADTRRR